MKIISLSICLFLLIPTTGWGRRLCDVLKYIECNAGFSGSRSSGSSNPQTSGGSIPSRSAIQSFNPSSISTKKQLGIETIGYHGNYDVNLASGTGAIGSGLSTTNSQGTFFGPPTNENDAHYEERKRARKKAKSHKTSLALAFKLFGKSKRKKRRKFWKPILSLGTITSHNRETMRVNGGLGISGLLGPFSASAARYRDDFYHHEDNVEQDFYVNTWSVGFNYFNFAGEYSVLDSMTPSESSVVLKTLNFFTPNFMLTAGERTDYSAFRGFNYQTKTFAENLKKRDYFGGLQLRFFKFLIAGVFYNYYLNRNLSVGLTLMLF